MREKTAARGYGARWQRERKHYLRAHPMCVYCKARGLLVPASVVDHITPHKGDETLMWDQGNWQSLCKPCHDTTKQRIDEGLVPRGCDTNGTPLDPDSHWHGRGR